MFPLKQNEVALMQQVEVTHDERIASPNRTLVAAEPKGGNVSERGACSPGGSALVPSSTGRADSRVGREKASATKTFHQASRASVSVPIIQLSSCASLHHHRPANSSSDWMLVIIKWLPDGRAEWEQVG